MDTKVIKLTMRQKVEMRNCDIVGATMALLQGSRVELREVTTGASRERNKAVDVKKEGRGEAAEQHHKATSSRMDGAETTKNMKFCTYFRTG